MHALAIYVIFVYVVSIGMYTNIPNIYIYIYMYMYKNIYTNFALRAERMGQYTEA